MKNVRIFTLVAITWILSSMAIAVNLSDELLGDDTGIYIFVTWVILAIAPCIPLIWIWVAEKSPWKDNWIFLGFIILCSGFVYLGMSYDFHLNEFAIVPFFWGGISILSSYLLRSKRSLKNLWAEKEQRLSNQINHMVYLDLLDQQLNFGLPTVSRVREYLEHNLPEKVPSLAESNISPKVEEILPYGNIAREFMLEKVSAELTYICTTSFLDRMCGPDYRYTQQFQGVQKTFLDIKFSNPDGLPDKDMDSLVSKEDLGKALEALERARKNQESKIGDSNTTVAVAGTVHIMASGLVSKEGFDREDFATLMMAAMRMTREMFSRQKTSLR